MAGPYTRQVRSSITLRMTPRAGSALQAIGGGIAAIGQGVAQGADALQRAENEALASQHRIDLAEQARGRQRTMASAIANMARADMELPDRLAELQKSLPPDAAGYTAAAQELVTEQHGAILEGIDDEEVLLELQPRLIDRERRLALGADAYERERRLGWQKENIAQFQDIRFNQAARGDTGFNLDASMKDFDALLAISDMTPDEIAVARGEFQEKLTATAVSGQIGGADATKLAGLASLFDKGSLDFLDPQSIGILKGQMAARGMALEREAELAAAEQLKSAREVLRSLKVDIENGKAVPLPAIQTALAHASAAKMPEAELKEFGYLAVDQHQSQSVLGLTTEQLTAQHASLQARREAGQLSPEDARVMGLIDKELDRRKDDDAVQLRPLLSGGPAQRVTGIKQLTRMPAAQAAAAAEAAGDPQAFTISRLPDLYQLRAVQGRELRRARPADFLPPKGPRVTDPAKELDRVYRQVLGPLVQDIGGDFGPIRDTALDLMAEANPGGWNPRDFGNAIQVTMGRSKRRDGTEQGGIDAIEGRMTVLPDRWSRSEFAQRYARYQFEGAIYAGGNAARPVDIRKHYRLQWQGENDLGESTYVLIDPAGRRLQRKRRDGALEDYSLVVPVRPR